MSSTPEGPGAPRNPKAEAKAAKAYAKATRPWFKKKRFIIPAVLLLLLLFSKLGGGSDTGTSTDAAKAPESTATATSKAPATTEAATDSGADLTAVQKNARRSAENYLEMSGFSRLGLIDQLSSEYGDQFSKADATAAVDSMDVDWNEQAGRVAKAYLDMQGFSCQGLVDQMSSDVADKFTKAQATAGAKEAGAC